ncbi:MAG TPA: nuclear transport factor 2 family protein [Parafilimonas sp.]|nr:nuclear transport factor 2 family protein [Parafilimonas sp.]
MTTQEVADKFYELGEANQWDKIQDELFSDDAESIEPPNAASSGLKTVKGRAALKQKSIDFNNSIEEIYGGYSSKPVVGGNFFSVAMGMDAKFKGMDRIQFDEICVYEVKDGKIVKEQFFY